MHQMNVPKQEPVCGMQPVATAHDAPDAGLHVERRLMHQAPALTRPVLRTLQIRRRQPRRTTPSLETRP